MQSPGLTATLEDSAARRGPDAKSQNKVKLSEFVFHRSGKRIHPIRTARATACTFANLPGRLFHDLRRCAVRNMVCAGVPTDVARSISVHKSASIFSPCNIVAEDQKRDALERTLGYVRESVEQQRERSPKSSNQPEPSKPPWRTRTFSRAVG